MSRIVITDCDQGEVDIERGVFEAAGHTVSWEQCRSAEDVIRTGEGADALLVQYMPITAAVMDATGLSNDDVWVVFEEVNARDWYVGKTDVETLRKG